MAKTCDKCGAIVGDKARFCGKCGSTLQSSPEVSNSGEQIPTWKGWDVPASTPAAPAPSVPQGQQTSAVRFTKPATTSAGTPGSQTVPVTPSSPSSPSNQSTWSTPSANASTFAASPSAAPYATPAMPSASAMGSSANAGDNAPQFWESYDFESASSGQTHAYSPSGAPVFEPRSDASRPLPKLDEIMSSLPSSSGGNEELIFSEDIDDDLEARRAKAYDTVTTFSLWCAGLVLLPMPFIDLVFLLPIQSAMVMAVGKIYGVKQTPEKVIALLAGACGLTIFGEISALTLAQCLPIIGKLLSAPFVFGWSYGMGEVAIRFFESRGKASKSELKQIFKKASKEASKNFDRSKVNPQDALNNIRNYVSEDEYRKIRERFGPQNS